MEPACAPILIVEDDPICRSMLATYFGRNGYEAKTACSLAEARSALQRRPTSVMLLDIGLPDGDGIEFARELREESAVGIIFVTNHDRDIDRILGLEAAGDDYVTKPVNLRELLARVRCLSRRRRLDNEVAQVQAVLTFDGWLIDLRRRELARRGGDPLRLTRAEFDLLAALAMARGATLTRDYLVEVVSKRGIAVTPRTVDALVARLRRKLAAVDPGRCPICTVISVGYRLDAKVTGDD